MKQVPFTTYRPVYRTETYTVPVTYTTPAPAAPACNTCAPTTVQSAPAPACSTCAAPAMVQAPVGTINNAPYYQSTPTPATGATLPADTIPSLNNSPQNMQRPILDGSTSKTTWPAQIETQTTSGSLYSPIQDPNPSDRWNNNSEPQLQSPVNQSASAPSVQRWNYSPVKLASYQTPTDVPVALRQNEPVEYVGAWTESPRQPESTLRVNDGWRND